MPITTKSRFNIALEDHGFILSRQPENPAYVVQQSGVFGNRFAQGDRTYEDFSFWWYWAQTDWSGGVVDFPSWEDNATLYASRNIDTWSTPGVFKIERAPTLEFTATSGIDANGVGSFMLEGTLTNIRWTNDGAFEIDSNTQINSGSANVKWVHGHRGYAYILMAGSSGFYRNDGTVNTNMTTDIDAVLSGGLTSATAGGDYAASIGDTVYVAGHDNDRAPFIVKSSVQAPAASGDWTQVLYRTGFAGSFAGFAAWGGNLYYILTNTTRNFAEFRVYNPSSGADTLIYVFSGTDFKVEPNYINVLPDKLVITIPSSTTNKGTVWTYDGALTKIYDTDPAKLSVSATIIGFLEYGGVVWNNKVWWGRLMYDGATFHNWMTSPDDDDAEEIKVLGSTINNNRLYFTIEGQENLTYYIQPGIAGNYRTGDDKNYLVFTNQDKVAGIEKLASSITLIFDTLQTGGEIKVEYTTGAYNSSTTWTSLGEATFAADGAINKKVFQFGDAVRFNKIWVRVFLNGTTTVTPVIQDFVMAYLPMPNHTKSWAFALNCADEIIGLDGTALEETGRELAAFLEKVWMTKEIVSFQDIDYAATQLDGALTANATTITVDTTEDFPEEGRLLIGSEEIFYSGKTPKSFTGCLRGQQGSVAVAHLDNAAVYTGYYRVLVTEFKKDIPILQKDKMIESVVTLNLREVGVV